MDILAERIEPFRIVGGLHYVGAAFGPSYLLDTGAGLMVFDTGMPQTFYQTVQSIWQLGFDPRDVRVILHSHGHVDHIGGTRALVGLSGAKTYIGRGDEDYANGRLPLHWAEELGIPFDDFFDADEILDDGDIVQLGNVAVRCLATPGHTPGTMSFFFELHENGRTLRVGGHGGVGMNSMERTFLKRRGLSFDCRERFLAGLARLEGEAVDVCIGNHLVNNHSLEKLERQRREGGNPFVDPDEWPCFLADCRARLVSLLASEARTDS